VLVFGIGAYFLLPVAALPNVDFPTITVSAQLPGASPDTMASSVATPLEQQFGAIPDLSQMTSTSGLGSTSITLQFDLSRDIDGRPRTSRRRSMPPAGCCPRRSQPADLSQDNPADRPVLIYAVHSDDLPIYKVDDYVSTILAQKLSTTPGVSQVIVAGQQTYAPHIQVNPMALASRGVGLEDVRTAISNATLDQAKGRWKGPSRPIPSIPTTSSSTPMPIARSSSPIATARPCVSRMSATSSIRCSRTASAPGTTTRNPSCC
jgi:Cation/multidrug efflux pump